MSANVFMQATAETQKPSVLYSYPTTVYVFKVQTEDGEIHIIHAPTAVTPSTDLANAPNGSLCIGATDKLYFKTGTFGKTDGTWTATT